MLYHKLIVPVKVIIQVEAGKEGEGFLCVQMFIGVVVCNQGYDKIANNIV